MKITLLLFVSQLFLSPAALGHSNGWLCPEILTASHFEIHSQPKVIDVTIFLWKPNEESASSKLGLAPVNRRVLSHAPLRQSLEALFAGPTKEETDQGFSSATFGMKFVEVTLNEGVALVRFSQPKGETNYGSSGPAIFVEAIVRTAKQFPT